MDIDVEGVGLIERRRHIARPQQREQSQRPRRVQMLDGRAEMGDLLLQRVEGAKLIGSRDHQHAARRQDRMLGEARRRLLQEGAAGPGQAPDRPVAVILGEQRGRTAGGVIAGLALALQNQHPPMLGEGIGGRGAGNTGADDDEINGLHNSLRNSMAFAR